MRCVTLLGLLMLTLSVAAFGQAIDPNIGFCAPTATATLCSGQPETDPLAGNTFGMWSHGAQDANSPWYLLLSVPEVSGQKLSAVQPAITSSSFTATYTAQAEFDPNTAGSIYGLFTQTSSLGGNSSMNASNMFYYDTKLVGTVRDFDVLLYTVTPGFNGNTAYAFNASPSLITGTYVAAVGVGGNNNNIQFSTPFTDTGLVGGPPGVPDGGMTLMLLGGALVGLETLRRKFRV